MENTNLTQQLEAFFDKEIYLDSDGRESHCFNFYDWFCEDDELQEKADYLFNEVNRFVGKFGINTDIYYVFFKNNCPMSGPLYDSFSICEVESGDVAYWVTPKSGHSGQAEICGASNDFNKPLYVGNTLSEIYRNLK